MTASNASSPAGPRHGRLLHVTLISSALAGFAETARAQAEVDPAPAGAIALPSVDVQGRGAGALADTQGFVSRRDATRRAPRRTRRSTRTRNPCPSSTASSSTPGRCRAWARRCYTAGVQSEAFGADPHVDWFNIRGFSTNDTGLYLNGLRVSLGVTLDRIYGIRLGLTPHPAGLAPIAYVP